MNVRILSLHSVSFGSRSELRHGGRARAAPVGLAPIGVQTLAAQTVMRSVDDRVALADSLVSLFDSVAAIHRELFTEQDQK